ncbi:Protein of unknown function [Lactobacillus helveticus CIRM-BIA 953]|uniref:Uncharacterized protein n=1 Tax=Lactobacillus helveticus CIRM-BIA 953 TaxID=1226335 RepID=U4QET4_LACHE|nr:Protein of unknown function [Lactobacillus helveticus CIRM-BIA 953]
MNEGSTRKKGLLDGTLIT